jgi:hypothetical protein
VFEFVLEVAVTFENLFEIVAGIRHAMLQLVHLMFDLLQTSKGSKRRLMNRRTRFEVNVLVQQTKLHSTRAHDVTTIRRFITSDETKDRAFPGPVASYQAHVLTRIYLQRRTAQNILNTVRLMNI